ncbi:MAG TPA: hypothetical protein VKF36_14885 [Syntrophorhabdales bacterium]|nr:hypothetical protein [Syntrophorhabdales bacterium]
MAKRDVKIKWLKKSEEHDYPAALSYLSLLYPQKVSKEYVAKLKRAQVSQFKSKDIFRASRLPLLGLDNYHVKKDKKKIESHERLSPLLLVREPGGSTVIIADGYHRLCAVYGYDEDAVIPCKIV